MILHNIDIHLFMPAGIDSPGFVEEEKEKPAVTKKIEESDEQISAEKCAEYLIAGAFLSWFLPCFTSSIISTPDLLFFLSLTTSTVPFHRSVDNYSCHMAFARSAWLVLMAGVEKGYYQFTSHLIAELIRVVSKGSAPGNNLLLDTLYTIVALVSPRSLQSPLTPFSRASSRDGLSVFDPLS